MDTSIDERHALLSAEIAREYPYLMRFARSRVRDEHLAEDAVQETLAAALEALATYDGRSTLRTWLTGVLIHKIHDLFRRGARDGDVPAADLPEPVDALSPERRLHSKQLGAAFLRAFEALPPRQADALVLREVNGLEAEEVCDRLGVSAANLWVLLHRARSRLRLALAREGFAPSG